MTTVKDVYDILDKFCPFNTAMDFDNVGILVGKPSEPVKNILVSLDVTDDIMREASYVGANLIITHHPVIFDPIKKIHSTDIVHKLIKNGFNVICAHTNLDMAKGGVNDALAEALTLVNTKPLTTYKTGEVTLPMGLVGTLEYTLSSVEFANFVKRALNCSGLRFTNLSEKKYISKVGLCSGSGGNLISDAISAGVDAFVTGEIKHHEILKAIQHNITVVDVGHFQSENLIVKRVAEVLNGRFNGVKVYMSNARLDKIAYVSYI